MKTKVIILFILIVFLFSSCGKEEKVYNSKLYKYNDGVAWVQLTKTKWMIFSENAGVVCIDESGSEIFSLSANKNQLSNFNNGIALVSDGRVIDKNGNTVRNLSNDFGIESIIIPIYFEGHIFVSKDVNKVEMTGLLNNNFEWVIEPTSKLNDIKQMGNHIYYNKSIGYYDALENEKIDSDEFTMRHIQRCFTDSGIIFLKGEGQDKFTYSTKTTKGEIKLGAECKTGLYNSDLQMVLDLSMYNQVTSLSEFQNGKCLIEFTTHQNGKIVGLIDINGEFIFLKNGYLRHNSERIEFSYNHYDWDGNIIINNSN